MLNIIPNSVAKSEAAVNNNGIPLSKGYRHSIHTLPLFHGSEKGSGTLSWNTDLILDRLEVMPRGEGLLDVGCWYIFFMWATY